MMAASIEALNIRLQSNPPSEGKSRERGYRIVFAESVSVLVHVNEKSRLVRVTSVRPSGR